MYPFTHENLLSFSWYAYWLSTIWQSRFRAYYNQVLSCGFAGSYTDGLSSRDFRRYISIHYYCISIHYYIISIHYYLLYTSRGHSSNLNKTLIAQIIHNFSLNQRKIKTTKDALYFMTNHWLWLSGVWTSSTRRPSVTREEN